MRIGFRLGARFDELKDYVGFTAEDSGTLADAWGVVQGRVPWLMDRFYDRILRTPAAREVLGHERQVESLKQTLAVWLEELFRGPHDDAYYDRRARIGTRHVEVGLPARFMFTAMSGFAQDLEIVIHEGMPSDRAVLVERAVRRITDLDLAIMTGAFVERRETRQLRSLQDLIVTYIPVAVLVVDGDGVVTLATERVTGLFHVGDPVGGNWRQAIPEALAQAADLEGLIGAALASRAPVEIQRVDADLGDGMRSFRLSVVPLEHPQARVLLHVEDLSPAIEVEARMQQSEALARLGSMSAAVAHELRNPLAGMSAALQVLRPSFDQADRRGAILAKVQDQVVRLDGLVADLLSFARPGQASLRSVDLAEVAGSVLELVRHDAPVTMAVELRGEGRAHADPNLVHQLVLNLVQNALQAQEGRGTVLVIVTPGAIAVEDAGPGIPPDLRDKIFQPFFTTKARGTGLGLAICHRMARSMDARIDLTEAHTLSGARFELTFLADLG